MDPSPAPMRPQDPVPEGPAIEIRTLFVREGRAGHQVAAHRHQALQWYHCLDGQLRIDCGATVHELAPGEGILIPGGVERGLRCLLPTRYLVCITVDRLLACEPACGRVLRLPRQAEDDLAALTDELETPGGLESSLLCRALVVRCLIALRREATRGDRGPQAAALVEEVDHILRRNRHRRITRREIADALGWSEATLARRYAAATGRSVHQRLVELRLALARQLLRESDLSVERIAEDCGFASTSHFTAVFRAVDGCSPGRWRRELGKGLAV